MQQRDEDGSGKARLAGRRNSSEERKVFDDQYVDEQYDPFYKGDNNNTDEEGACGGGDTDSPRIVTEAAPIPDKDTPEEKMKFVPLPKKVSGDSVHSNRAARSISPISGHAE